MTWNWNTWSHWEERAALWSSRNEDCLSVFKVVGGKSVDRTHPGNAQRSYTIERERAGVGQDRCGQQCLLFFMVMFGCLWEWYPRE